MLIFLRHKLAYLATPKTGTTAVELALRSEAEVIFAKNRKHVTAQRFKNKVSPFIEDTFGVRLSSVAVMRDPVDQIRSWYKYRSGDRLAGTELSTRGISFDTYVSQVIAADPPPRAKIGSQFNFLTDSKGQVVVNHLFSYDNQDGFLAFLSKRMGQNIDLQYRNVSPTPSAKLSDDMRAKLQSARAAEFALYDRLTSNGGHLSQS